MFAPKPLSTQKPSNSTPLPESEVPALRVLTQPTKQDAFMYLLDLDNDGWSSDDEFEENYGILVCSPTAETSWSSGKFPAVPPPKQQKLEVPYHVQCEKDRAFQIEKLKSELRDVNKLLKSVKT